MMGNDTNVEPQNRCTVPPLTPAHLYDAESVIYAWLTMFVLRWLYSYSSNVLRWVDENRALLLQPRQVAAMGTYIVEILITSISLLSCLTVGRGLLFDWSLETVAVTEAQWVGQWKEQFCCSVYLLACRCCVSRRYTLAINFVVLMSMYASEILLRKTMPIQLQVHHYASIGIAVLHGIAFQKTGHLVHVRLMAWAVMFMITEQSAFVALFYFRMRWPGTQCLFRFAAAQTAITKLGITCVLLAQFIIHFNDEMPAETLGRAIGDEEMERAAREWARVFRYVYPVILLVLVSAQLAGTWIMWQLSLRSDVAKTDGQIAKQVALLRRMREIEDREAKALGEGRDARTMVAPPITPSYPMGSEADAAGSSAGSHRRKRSEPLRLGGRPFSEGRTQRTQQGVRPLGSPRALRPAGSMRDLLQGLQDGAPASTASLDTGLRRFRFRDEKESPGSDSSGEGVPSTSQVGGVRGSQVGPGMQQYKKQSYSTSGVGGSSGQPSGAGGHTNRQTRGVGPDGSRSAFGLAGGLWGRDREGAAPGGRGGGGRPGRGGEAFGSASRTMQRNPLAGGSRRPSGGEPHLGHTPESEAVPSVGYRAQSLHDAAQARAPGEAEESRGNPMESALRAGGR